MTILLTPFMSCTAKLPIYGLIANTIFSKNIAWLVILGLYLLGIVMAIIVAIVFKKFIFKGEAIPFVMELPNYRVPGTKNVLQLLWEKAKDFLQRAFTIIFLASIVVWCLKSFDFKLNYTTDTSKSILATFANLIAPIFKIQGFDDYRIVTALITGFIAKESVSSTLTVLFGSTEAIAASLTMLSALSFLSFCLLYTPCVAAIAAIRRELGKKWALIIVVFQCAIAWIVSLLIYAIGLLITIL